MMTIIDHATKFRKIWILNPKTSKYVWNNINKIVQFVQGNTCFKTKVLLSDIGCKSCSQDLQNYPRDKGINPQKIIKYSLKTNRVSEHLCLTILDLLQTNLIHNSLPELRRTDKASATIYFHNKTSVALDEQLTPKDMLLNKIGHTPFVFIKMCSIQ
jgi:hypothetical protein